MALDKELSDFLQGAQRCALRQAAYAVRRDEAAPDIVQDAMIKLAERYAERPAAELPMLFQRILQNTILDFFRREKVRNAWLTVFSGLNGDRGWDDGFDILDSLEVRGDGAHAGPPDPVERTQLLQAIDEELQKLPARQRQAFLLRYWEDFDVAETAQAMGCSEGSVKRHCWRATQALAQAMRARGFE
ncbi:RNA polymerase sigma factor [Pseudoduganella sp. GCM10020061]|uniref:RNA polymerase sigma factor n=1 Tax=Pseudoduganella sp. GCM10020061 TaxID=3317345 RepID=UPI00364430A9